MTKCVLEVVSMRGTICRMFYIQILVSVVAAARSTVVDTGMEGSTDVVVVDTDGIVVVAVRSTFDVAVDVEFDDGVCDEEEDVVAEDEEDTKDIPDLRFVAVESFVENYSNSLRVDMSHTSLHMDDSSSISCFFSLSKTSNAIP